MSIDISSITSQFMPANIVPTLLIVAATLASCYAWLRAMGWTLRAIRGEMNNANRDRAFAHRYRRETANREYRAWKKRKGFL